MREQHSVPRLLVVREGGEVVGVVGVVEDLQTGVTDIGPLAVSVSRQKTGLGGRIMRCLEAEYDITSVGVVSCRHSRASHWPGSAEILCSDWLRSFS